MHTIEASNAAMALPKGLHLLLSKGTREQTRAGDCLVAPGPVMTKLTRPTERVVFSPVRDANPFFHLVESLWMLAGREDAATLNHYVADFGERFAESNSGRENAEAGGRIHGAYGHRWRFAHGLDQLEAVVHRLKKEPGSRQCVIQMWDCGQRQGREMSYGCDDLMGDWRDRPCNTHVYLRIRDDLVRDSFLGSNSVQPVLDVTVCCRSNDVVWGLYGANAVHFSVLQEYLAARLHVEVGHLYVLSNNFHVYESMIDVLVKRTASRRCTDLVGVLYDNRYASARLRPEPMFDRPERVDQDVKRFFEWHEQITSSAPDYENKWFRETATRVVRAHWLFKSGQRLMALAEADCIGADDWRVACKDWLERRTTREKSDEQRSGARV